MIEKELVDTKQHPLSEKELEDVVVRVTKAMAEGAALNVAVRDALPKRQTIWDTKENTAMRGDGDPKFVPFVTDDLQRIKRLHPQGAAVPLGELRLPRTIQDATSANDLDRLIEEISPSYLYGRREQKKEREQK